MIYIGTLLAIIAELRYIYSIIAGNTKANFSAWGIFTVSMILVLLSAYSLGARESLFIIGAFALLHLVTTILAFRFRIFELSKFEKFLLLIMILSVIVWAITKNAWTALLINIGVDALGYMDIIYKLYLHPKTEDVLAWIISFIAYGINLFLITKWTPQEYLFSVSNIFWIGIILSLLLRTKIMRTEKTKNV